MDAATRTPTAINEPVLDYAPGSAERASLEEALKTQAAEHVELTMTIGGEQRLGAGDPIDVVQPHARHHVLGTLRNATHQDAADAVAAAKAAAPAWRALSFDDRAAVILKAADLLAGPWRQTLNAATVLGQSKTCYQAEIDAACELIDFWRFNVQFGRQILEEQPISGRGVWNRLDHRPLEGFVYAITPFNFTAIAGNLPTAPALMGNTVVWKASPTQQLAAHQTMRLLEAAGLPPGVINLVTGDGIAVSEVVLADPDLAGIHFTGSTRVFQHLWRTVGENIDRYRTYPRLVGETGGKDFVLAHPSADPDVLRVALIRGAFEFQGQKCSAASRAYVPRSVWSRMRDGFLAEVEALRMGPTTDFGNFLGAVIDDRSFGRLSAAIDRAHATDSLEVVAGGTYDDSEGWYVRPTVLSAPTRPTRPSRPSTSGRSSRSTSMTTRTTTGCWRRWSPPRRTPSPARSSRRTATPSPRRPSCSASPRATSTSTTSPPAPSSGSSPSAAVGPAAPTTRPAPRRTSCAGPPPGRSRRRSPRRRTTDTPTWVT